MLEEVVNVTMRPLLIITGRRETSVDWTKANVTPVFKKGKEKGPVNYKRISLTLILGEVMEQILLETISEHIKDKR